MVKEVSEKEFKSYIETLVEYTKQHLTYDGKDSKLQIILEVQEIFLKVLTLQFTTAKIYYILG
jgi:hypothetical protein